jgi:uncharacterized protein (TIRG00374 family)
MSRRLQLALSLVGAALLTFLLGQIGLAALASDLARTGWWLVPISLVHLPVYALNALAWQLTLAEQPRRPPYHRFLTITISGFAINYLTPIVSMGGEPYKVAAVARWVGTRQATGSVILFTMLHALSHLILWLTAVIAALIILRPPPVLTAALMVLGASLAALTALAFALHRKGGVEDLVALLRRAPLLGRLARRLDAHHEILAEIDRQITDFYHRDRRRFFQALALEYIARALSTLEYWFIFLSLNLPLGPGHAFLVGSFSSLILNLLFFIPFELGSKEGGLYALLELIARDGGAGLAGSIISRLRELAWIAMGLLLIWAGATPAPGLELAPPLGQPRS